ncbi:MAG TPA: PQQ-binding-like beta-propeller repeat protein [Rhodanobacteraceae bacterium]|jgi:hypothetical protein|nr:PQQ-binding-like beta-propeller repeat protein [Rhodanobacteraceae bacterium]
MRQKSTLICLLGAVIAAVAAVPAQATDWRQFGQDTLHSSNNREEKGYSTGGNKLAYPAVTLAHQTDSAPIFLEGVATTAGVKNLLFVNALDGTLTAFDAANGNVVWSHQPTPAAGASTGFSFGGTTGSPAIDASRQFVYAYAIDGNVHKYAVGTGAEEKTSGTVTGKTNGWPEQSTVKPQSEKGASGLSIATTVGGAEYLYAVTNGYNGDGGDYQGHVTAINLASYSQHVFNAECSNQIVHIIGGGCNATLNGIWGRSGAVYVAAIDRVFVATANGPYDGNSGGQNWGDSVLALYPDGSGVTLPMNYVVPVDSYTPASFAALKSSDADLGSTAPAVIPIPVGDYPHIAVQGGKDGCTRIINLDDLSNAGHNAAGHVGGELYAVNLPGTTNHCIDGGNIGTYKTQPAVWIDPVDGSAWVFVGHNDGIVGYQLTSSAGVPQLSQRWSSTNSGTSPVVANDVLYYASTAHVRALDPRTGSLIWNDGSIASLHWQSPIVVNGHLYLIDNTSKLWTYQLDGVFRGKFD